MKASRSIKNLYDSFRVKDWGSSFINQMIGLCFLMIYEVHGQFSLETLLQIILFIISSIGFAAFGYLVNDLFDIESDKKAGKESKFAQLSLKKRLLLFISSLSFMLLPWYFLPTDELIFYLIGLQLLLYFLYSVPPIRLKERPFLSIIADASYAYVIPLILCIITFANYYHFSVLNINWIYLIICFFFAGCKNILLHQLEDIDFDKKAGIYLLPSRLGQTNTKNIIHAFSALEVGSFLWFLFLQATQFDAIYFILVAYFGSISVYQLFFAKKQQLTFFNTFYQHILPRFLVGMLILVDENWMYVVIPYFLLFHFRFLQKIWNAIKPILSKIANYSIYYFLRIFGIDLKKANTSMMQYFRNKRK